MRLVVFSRESREEYANMSEWHNTTEQNLNRTFNRPFILHPDLAMEVEAKSIPHAVFVNQQGYVPCGDWEGNQSNLHRRPLERSLQRNLLTRNGMEHHRRSVESSFPQGKNLRRHGVGVSNLWTFQSNKSQVVVKEHGREGRLTWNEAACWPRGALDGPD